MKQTYVHVPVDTSRGLISIFAETKCAERIGYVKNDHVYLFLAPAEVDRVRARIKDDKRFDRTSDRLISFKGPDEPEWQYSHEYEVYTIYNASMKKVIEILGVPPLKR